jgi:hypothetical protein
MAALSPCWMRNSLGWSLAPHAPTSTPAPTPTSKYVRHCMRGEWRREHDVRGTHLARRAVRVDVLHSRRSRRGRRGRRDRARRAAPWRHGFGRRHGPGRPHLVRVPGRARVRLRRARARGEVETLASASDCDALVAGEVPVLRGEARVACVDLRGPVVMGICASIEAASSMIRDWAVGRR